MRHIDIMLGGLPLRMPSITLGTVRFGVEIDRESAFALMDQYAAAGGTWLDTARVYGPGRLPAGQRLPHFKDSETVIGEWLRSRGIRDRVVIITKGGHRCLETEKKRVTPEDIRYDLEHSLQALGLESVDIYFLHEDDETMPVSDIMPVLHEFVKNGRARGLGASNWRVQRIEEANRYAAAHGLTPFGIGQVRWSYAVPPDDRKEHVHMETDPLQYEGFKRLGIPVMAYSSQAKGFFMKTAELGFDPAGLGKASGFLSDENICRAERVFRISEAKGISVATAGFAYLWSREIPVTALVGCKSPEQLKSSLNGCDYLPEAGLFSL